ncbi:hypothetical protein Y025_6322 [Burkholderia pseudomallei TSV32]|nr:hypothetical protein Y025_6322 [Burkholderia pseudomallei TSV32]
MAVVTSRAPDAPSGCPSAIAPPFGFTRASSSATPSSRSTASPCDANASFSSITSNWSSVIPSRASSFCVAGAGPIPITRGSTPAVAIPSTRARGTSPWRRAAASLATSSAHAPSFTPDALPAVTVPSGRTTPLSFASASRVVSRGCSSRATTSGSPFFCAIVTGAISCASVPSACARAAFCWLRSANAS